MHWRQPGFTYSEWEPITKNKDRIQKFKETGDSRYIYKNEQDKVCFQHDMAYRNFKDLSEEQLLIKYYIIQYLIFWKIQNMMDIKGVVLHWFINFFIKSRQVVDEQWNYVRPRISWRITLTNC